jgi:16S rRNA processing protein RimM
MPAGRTPRVLLGRILRAHGLRGEVEIAAYTARPQDIAAYGPLWDAAGGQHTITLVRATSKGVVARLAGIGDRTAAEALKGVELYVDREVLPETAAGEFYHADLVGLLVVDPQGRVLGRVVAMHNFGAGDVIEIGLPSQQTHYIPFTETHVPEIDIGGGRVVVAIPLDDAAGERE